MTGYDKCFKFRTPRDWDAPFEGNICGRSTLCRIVTHNILQCLAQAIWTAHHLLNNPEETLLQ